MQENLVPEDLKHVFPDHVHQLDELILATIKKLEDQPDYTKLRVFLSFLFYKKGCFSFAKRELREIKRYSDSSLLDRIIKSLGGLESDIGSKVFAEVKL